MIMIHKIFSKLEKGASLLSLMFVASLSSFIASGAEFYVDSRAEPGGTGTQASPLAPLRRFSSPPRVSERSRVALVS